MKRAFLVAILAIALLSPGLTQVDAASSETYRQLNLFGDVFERVKSDYVEKVSDEKLIEAAIQGMLTSLDPHSSYMNPESFSQMQVETKGEFGGLGIEVTMENGYIKVVSPIDGTPAAKAGVKTGDIITQLDGKPVMGMTLSDAVNKMRGPIGSDITLTIVRKGEKKPIDITITRDKITIQSVRWHKEGRVGYIRITSFTEQTQDGVVKAMESLKSDLGDKLEGIVLDLRNDPGGLLDQAISVADDFLNKGEIVSTRGRRADSNQRYDATPGDLAQGLPIVVLINGGTASASEIVAGALQDDHRAIILGEKSFGKGSVQTIIPLPGHGAIRLTTARYYTPSGRSIQAKGITPNIVVPEVKIDHSVVADANMPTEASLPNALPPQNTGTPTPSVEKQYKRTKEASNDYQLERALDLIDGLTLMSDEMSTDSNAGTTAN